MKTNRWMTWVLDEADKTTVALPFERQERDAEVAIRKLRKAG